MSCPGCPIFHINIIAAKFMHCEQQVPQGLDVYTFIGELCQELPGTKSVKERHILLVHYTFFLGYILEIYTILNINCYLNTKYYHKKTVLA